LTHIEEPELTIDLDVLGTEPADEYHAKASHYLSSHQLIDFMNCPWLYRKKQLGLMQREETAAMLIGRATHCRILEGRDAYESQFALGGPINPKYDKPFGKDTKAFGEWAEAQGKPGIHYDDLDLIENLASGLSMNSLAVDLLLYGRSEGVIRTEYCGFECQARLDWVHPHMGLADLKTVSDLDRFEFEARRRRYHNQMAFYQDMLKQVTGEEEPIPVYLIAVEKAEPYRCGVWQVSEQTLEQARRENWAAMDRLKQAHKQDYWPTGYESMRLLNVA
jgi:hypothetical protein